MKEPSPILQKIQRLKPLQRKVFLSSAFVVTLLLMPDWYWAVAHHVLGFLHLFYEGLCYMLEEFIGHSLDLSKYESQLILFYSQVAIIAGFAYKTWRVAPGYFRRLRADFHAAYQELVTDGKEAWSKMPFRKRFKVVMGCVAGMFGIYFWVTS